MYESLLGRSLAGTLRSVSSISVSKGSSVISSAHCVVPGFPEGEKGGGEKLNKVRWILQHYLPEACGTSQKHRCHLRKTSGGDEMFRVLKDQMNFYLQAGRYLAQDKHSGKKGR